MKTNKKWEVWTFISMTILIVYLIFMIYPLSTLLRNSMILKDGGVGFANFQSFFAKSYNLQTIYHSFAVSFCATIITLIVGIPLGYFHSFYKIKGQKILQVFIILCGMSAPFIGAYSWILLMGRNGLVTQLFKNLFGIKLPTIYGFRGIMIVECMQLYPLVFLYFSAALKNIDNTLLEASENMGCSGWKRFLTLVIPLCAPSIIAATLMVFMRAFADFGTPLFIGEGYKTFPVEIYNSFMSETGSDKHYASAVAVIAIVITTIIFLIQRFINSRFSFSMNALHPIEKKPAKGIKGVLIHLYCYLVVIIAYAPQVYVMYTSFLKTKGKRFLKEFSVQSYIDAWKFLDNAIPNTFIIAGTSLIIIIILSIMVAYLVVRRNNFANKLIDTLSMIPYVIPGSVVGISLVLGFSRKPIVLVGTFAIMIVALVIRRNSYTIRSSIAILQQIPMSIEEAAISLGSSKMKAFFAVTMPMMINGILSGALLSWISIITELSSGIILYNYRTTTLTIQIYTYVSRGSYGIAAAMATILSLMTSISLIGLMLFSKNKNVMF